MQHELSILSIASFCASHPAAHLRLHQITIKMSPVRRIDLFGREIAHTCPGWHSSTWPRHFKPLPHHFPCCATHLGSLDLYVSETLAFLHQNASHRRQRATQIPTRFTRQCVPLHYLVLLQPQTHLSALNIFLVRLARSFANQLHHHSAGWSYTTGFAIGLFSSFHPTALKPAVP